MYLKCRGRSLAVSPTSRLVLWPSGFGDHDTGCLNLPPSLHKYDQSRSRLLNCQLVLKHQSPRLSIVTGIRRKIKSHARP
jgi:hypothetical protein